MPKKTKKEKIIAEYRRKLKSTAVTQTESKSLPQKSSGNNLSAPATPVYKLSGVERKNISTSASTPVTILNDITAIRHDLAKTLMLAAVAITTELLLYWKIGR